MAPGNKRQFDVVRHRVRGLRAPYLIVLQHHDVPSSTCIVAPLSSPERGDHDAIAPLVVVEGREFRMRLLDMAAARRSVLLETVVSAASAADGITLALDVIFGGYPGGRPR
jgi:CcdB protein